MRLVGSGTIAGRLLARGEDDDLPPGVERRHVGTIMARCLPGGPPHSVEIADVPTCRKLGPNELAYLNSEWMRGTEALAKAMRDANVG